MEDLIQDCLDKLAEMMEAAIKTNNARTCMVIAGHVFNLGTELKALADKLGLDVDVRTPID